MNEEGFVVGLFFSLVLRSALTPFSSLTCTNKKPTLDRPGIPPCVWGSAEEGLLPPPRIHLDSNLSTIKYTNNTFGHWGIMALVRPGQTARSAR